MEGQNVCDSGVALGLGLDFGIYDRDDIQDSEIRLYLELRAEIAEKGVPVMEGLDKLRVILQDEVVNRFKAYEEFVQYVCTTVADQDKRSEKKGGSNERLRKEK